MHGILAFTPTQHKKLTQTLNPPYFIMLNPYLITNRINLLFHFYSVLNFFLKEFLFFLAISKMRWLGWDSVTLSKKKLLQRFLFKAIQTFFPHINGLAA